MKGYISIFLFTIFTAFLVCSVFADDNVKVVKKEETTQLPGVRAGFMQGRAGLNMMPGRMGIISSILRMEDKLKLSEDQKAKIHELVLSHRKDMISKNADVEIAEVELYELMQKDNPDMNAVKEKMQKIANMRADQQFSAFKLSMDVKNILTEEQWKEFKEQLKDKRPMIGNMERGRMKFGQSERKMRR